MSDLTLAIDNGPTDEQWREMAGRRDKYAPLIARLASFYLMGAANEDDRDFPLIGKTVESYIPEYVELTDDEAYFVHTGAVNIVCHYDAFAAILAMAMHWLEDGAPE